MQLCIFAGGLGAKVGARDAWFERSTVAAHWKLHFELDVWIFDYSSPLQWYFRTGAHASTVRWGRRHRGLGQRRYGEETDGQRIRGLDRLKIDREQAGRIVIEHYAGRESVWVSGVECTGYDFWHVVDSINTFGYLTLGGCGDGSWAPGDTCSL